VASHTDRIVEKDAVEVAFRNRAGRTFDLVIGADGMHSVVRALVFGDESPIDCQRSWLP
jgi:2-polyprenyl-6-methoxyphenol hydroxylase-like FAD-dependent oxidoreductase